MLEKEKIKMNETLNEHVIMLAQQREYTKEMFESVADARKELEATDEYIIVEEAKAKLNVANALEDMLYELVRSGALNVSEQSNYDDRTPHPATKVKKYNIVVIDNEKEAKQWAAKNAPSILSLNKSKLSRTTKELEVDFVHNEIEYRASVSRDLSDYVD